MIFQNDQQIFDRISKPINKDLLDVARKNSKLITKYVTGEGLKESIALLPYFEKDELTNIRKKMSRTTVDLMERLLEPINKVYTAKGGSEAYNLPESKEASFKNYMASIRKGLSAKEWIQFVALRAKLLDPMSLTYNEIDGQGRVYPTYKCTDSIHDYVLNGRTPEYVIFELDKGEVAQYVSAGVFAKVEDNNKVFRVVDDAFDKIVVQLDATSYNVVKTFPNYFNKVPAKINGDRMVYNSDLIESDLQPVMELVEDFFNDNSSKSLFKKYQMHAKEWGIHVECPRCEGTKKLGGEDCPDCGGTGVANTKVAQKLSIAINEDGKAMIPTPPGGFIVPPVDNWTMINNELDRLRKDVNDTFWTEGQQVQTQGLNSNTKGGNKTATEVVMSERHKEPKLKQYSKWSQDLQKFIADGALLIMAHSSTGSSIVYGDRYLLQTPEELTAAYEELRTKKAPIPILDSALIDLIDSKFSGNPFQQQKHMLLMKVEPFVHSNTSEVIAWNITDSLRNQKLLFSEWLSTKTDMDIIMSNEAALRADLLTYATANGSLTPEQPVSTSITERVAA